MEKVTDKEAAMRLAAYCKLDDDRAYFDVTGLLQDWIVIAVMLGYTKEDMIEAVENGWEDIKQIHSPN